MAAANRFPAALSVATLDQEPGASPGGRARNVWLLQLVMAASIALTVVLVQVLQPQLFGIWTFSTGVGMIVLLTALALALPWGRLPRNATMLIPFGDVVAVAFLAFGSEMRFSFFWAFPITWIATYFVLPALLTALAMIGIAIMIDATVLGPTPQTALRLLVVMLSLTFIGFTAFLTARQNRSFRQLLRRQAGRLQGTLQRVTGQERRVSQMLNGLDTGIARFSANGEVLALNDTYVSLYAIDRADPKRPGASVEYASLRGEPLPEGERPFVRAARGEQFDDVRVWLFDSQGEWHALSASTRQLTDSDDEPATTLLIVHDVTALIEAERARERLAAVVSHELRNPLTAIVGHTDLALEDESLSPRVREQLEVIDNAASRMQTLIAQMLHSSPGMFRDQSDRAEIDVRRVLDASVESFRPAADSRRVAVTLDAPDRLPLSADAFRLRQAFDNILSNAIKYTPGGGSVRIAATEADSAIVISFSDTGIGIAAEDLPFIFDAYFRARNARESSTPGTGLGMGITRAIIEQHGGTLSLESEQGTGTTVTVTLPTGTEG